MKNIEETRSASRNKIIELCRNKKLKFNDIRYGNEVVKIAFEHIPGFYSIELCNKNIEDNTRYFVIDNRMSDREIEEEIKFLIKGNLKKYTEEEIKHINNEYIKYHRNKQFLKSLSYGDVENIIKKYDMTYIEYEAAHELIEMYKQIREADRFNEQGYCSVAIAFKLGEMEGKRAERRRHKDTGVKKYIIDMIKGLEDIKELKIIFEFLKDFTGSNNKVNDKNMILENNLLKEFNKLNEEGKKQAIDSIEELTFHIKCNK